MPYDDLEALPAWQKEIRKEDQEQRWMEHQGDLVDQSLQAYRHILERQAVVRPHDAPVYERAIERSYHPDQEQHFIALNMPEVAPIREEAPPATVHESRRARKKREERNKAMAEAMAQDRKYVNMEAHLFEPRRAAARLGTSWNSEGLVAGEKELLRERGKTMDLVEKARLLAAGRDGEKDLEKESEIRWDVQEERAIAVGKYARTLPMGSKERAKAMAEKEAEEIKADKLRRRYRLTRIADPAERRREEKTLSRHAKYDALKKLFRKDSPLSHEDATWKNPLTGGTLVNVGRAFFGGTKPMYIFEDRSKPLRNDKGKIGGYKQYLYKEAVNCVGMYKPEGAVVTEAASKLQKVVCGACAIPAFAAQNADGRVLGSFQEKLETGEGGEDLFSWQAHPDHDLREDVKKEVLREHTLDWLLCNFDTKGENFLTRTDGHLSSFDKEASFSFLKDKGAQEMSRTYKPHANDTIYNVLFTQFAQGNLDLDLASVLPQVEKVERLSRLDYMEMFREMLFQKYGPWTEKNTARLEAEEAIWSRKANLREDYCKFFTGLLDERKKNLEGREPGPDGEAPANYDHLLDPDGSFRFPGREDPDDE